VLTGLDNGVSSYDITVGVSDTELLTITDAAVDREAGFGDEVIADDGSSVHLERALGDNTYEPTDEIVLGELTVETAADANGTAQLDFEETTINDLDSEAYDSQFDGATLEIVGELTAPDLTGNGQPATDTTGDGKLNDLGGTGEFGINDVQLLFENRNSEDIQNNPELFDFSDSGNVGIGDVQALFESL